MFEKLADAMIHMREEEAVEIADALLESGESPLEILDCCTKSMETVGELFEKGEYFLPELIMAGEMLKQISEKVKPKLAGEAKTEKLGKVLIGTVEGDIHDIGKNILVFLLDVNGFEVRDIGIDVSRQKFVEEIKAFQPQVVGMSGLLTLAFQSMKDTIEAIAEAGLRDRVKIMIGGGQMTERVCSFAGADAYGKDALQGVALARQWIAG